MNYRSCQTRIIRLFLLARRLRSKGTPLLPCATPAHQCRLLSSLTPPYLILILLPVLPLPSLFFLSFFSPLNFLSFISFNPLPLSFSIISLTLLSLLTTH